MSDERLYTTGWDDYELIDAGGGKKLAWFPTVISMPEKGMIFPEIKKEEKDWKWSVVKAINIPEEEQNKYPDPRNPGTFYKKRMNMEDIKRYGKLEFMDAAEELGMFAKQETNEDNKSN